MKIHMKMVRTSALTGVALLSAFTMVMSLVPAAQQAGASDVMGAGEIDAEQVQQSTAEQEDDLEAAGVPAEVADDGGEDNAGETEGAEQAAADEEEGESLESEAQLKLAATSTGSLGATAADSSSLEPKIEITQTTDKNYYHIGDTVQYVVEIRQTVEGAVAQDVKVECTLPYGHDYVDDVRQTGYEGDLLVWDRTYRLTYSTLEYGQVARLEFEAAIGKNLLNQVVQVTPTATGSNFTKTTDFLRFQVLGIERTGYETTIKVPVDTFYEGHGQVVPVLKITEVLADGSSTTAAIPISFPGAEDDGNNASRGSNCYCSDVVEEDGYYQAQVTYTSTNIGSKVRFQLVNCARYVAKSATSQLSSYQYEDEALIRWDDLSYDQDQMLITSQEEQEVEVDGVWQAEYDQITSDTMTIYVRHQTIVLEKVNQYGFSAARLVRNFIEAPGNLV